MPKIEVQFEPLKNTIDIIDRAGATAFIERADATLNVYEQIAEWNEDQYLDFSLWVLGHLMENTLL
jgi:hypothetical protein